MNRLTPISFLCLLAAAQAGAQPARLVPRAVKAPTFSAPAARPALPASRCLLPAIAAPKPVPTAREALPGINHALEEGKVESAASGLGRVFDRSPKAGDETPVAAAPGGEAPSGGSLAPREPRSAPPPRSFPPPAASRDRDHHYKEWHVLVAALLEVALIVGIPLLLTILLGLQ